MAFYQPPFMTTVSDVTASTLAPTVANSGTTYVLDRAAGIAVTLPSIDAGEVGTKFQFVIKTTITSNSTTIKVPSASETLNGLALIVKDDAGTPAMGFKTGATDDTVSLNGTTTGGIKGDIIEVEAISTTVWLVKVLASATGTEATPFSATVS